MNPLILREIVQSRGSGHRQVLVLRGVSLEVRRGDCVLLHGPSGSGKTTLLGVAAGLLTPASGEAWLAGHTLPRLSSAERSRLRARHVGFVFQRANLLEGLTLLDNVVLAGRLAGRAQGPARDGARVLLQRLGMERLLHRYPRELSGGEEQRGAVARALVHGPAVVLADEPTGSLDPAAGQAVLHELTAVAREQGTALVIATHDERAGSFATRRVRLEGGTVVED